MSARLVSLKPFRYASFMAVSISRVRLSGCGLPLLILSQLANFKLVSPVLSIPTACQFVPDAHHAASVDTLGPEPDRSLVMLQSIWGCRSQVPTHETSRMIAGETALSPPAWTCCPPKFAFFKKT